MDLGGCSAPSGSSFVYLPPQPIVQPTPEIPNPIVPIYTKEKNYTNIINRTYKFDVIPKIIYDPIYNLSNGSILYSRKIDLVNIENQTLNLAYRYECSSYNPQCLNENYCTITFYESDLIAKNYTTIKPGTAIPFRLNCAIPKTYLGRNIEGTIILSPQGFNPDYNEKRISVTLYPDIQSPISQYGSQISESVSPFISNLGTNFSLFLESFINLVKYYSSKLVGG
jgi:hypothetical protein